MFKESTLCQGYCYAVCLSKSPTDNIHHKSVSQNLNTNIHCLLSAVGNDNKNPVNNSTWQWLGILTFWLFFFDSKNHLPRKRDEVNMRQRLVQDVLLGRAFTLEIPSWCLIEANQSREDVPTCLNSPQSNASRFLGHHSAVWTIYEHYLDN